MRARAVHALLAAGLTAAGCGGGGREALPESPPTPLRRAAAPSASPGAMSAPIASALPPAVVPEPLPAPPLEMKSPVATAMLSDLRGLALDPRALPPIEKLDPKALRGVMKLIAKSLGAKCGDCHLEGDFAAGTPRKMIAAKMWDEFVAKLALATADGPLFCDSCHQGRTKLLNRTDKKALGRWMAANFVDGLKRKDEKEHGCETCHVDLDMRFLTRWSGGVALP
jgi:cytochrome c7-like protein